MAAYVLSGCSSADLSKEHFEAIDVRYICMHFTLDGVSYPDDLGQSMPADEMYARMAKGASTSTRIPPAEERDCRGARDPLPRA